MSSTAEDAEQDAIEMASRAVFFDKENKWEAAIYYYLEAANAVQVAFQLGSALPNAAQKIQEYKNRAAALTEIKNSENVFTAGNAQQQEMERAEFLLYQAFDEDAAGNIEEAVELYSEAVELCLQAV